MAAKQPKKKEEKQQPEYIHITFDRPRHYHWSTGKYLGKVYAEAKENKKLVSNRCPKCKRVKLPLMGIVCPYCKIETGWDWVEIPQTGTVFQYTYLVYPLWDPHYGEKWANPYPSAIIKLDDGTYFRHFLEETDKEKLREGMRVQAVWKENYDERGEGIMDILYFRTIEE